MNLVTVYDLATKKTTSIPEDELAPGMVLAKVEGVAGRVWVDGRQIRLETEYKHPPFSAGIRDMLAKIKNAVDEVYPMSLEKWEDGFRRDTNPKMEIDIWMRIAKRYSTFVSASGRFTKAQRQELFNVMLGCTTSPTETVMKTVTLSAISKEEAQRAIEAFVAAIE